MVLPNVAQRRVVVDLSVAELDAGSSQGNMVMPYIQVKQQGGQAAWLDIDDVRFIEWRDATGAFGAFTMARSSTGTAAELPFEVHAPGAS